MAIPAAAAGGAGDGPKDRIRELQALLLRLGEMRFGPPAPEIERIIRGLQDQNRLEALLSQLLRARRWQELLPPGPEGTNEP